ncbi:hypothetical protein EVAR_52947_1 [Eumeta japonica]|uniref:Uncharacterized protein n=1 Tax=Eumeta variegata TaxID=151549 RepID=A0A4C1XQN8_EUMVA|nr:hypothetical protein EVAR_52947_1 [Eumeta japonica]
MSGRHEVMVLEMGESTTEYDILIEGEKVKQVKEFVYLGSPFTNDDAPLTPYRVTYPFYRDDPVIFLSQFEWVLHLEPFTLALN